MHDLEGVVAQFAGGKVNIEVGDDVPAERVVESARRLDGLLPAAEAIARRAECPSGSAFHLASAIEFVLEGLHVNNRLTKYSLRERTFYKQ